MPIKNGEGIASPKAQATIKVFGLNERKLLVERRKKLWNDFMEAYKNYKKGKETNNTELKNYAAKILKRMLRREAEHLGMLTRQIN